MSKAKETTTGEKTATLTIAPPNLQRAVFKIRGTAPYVQHKFSQKKRIEMHAKHEAGSTAAKGKKREPRDFQADYEGAKHVAAGGWCGIPAPAIRNALISACRMCGFQMTRAKLSVFVCADGFDRDDATPLIKITKGEPEYLELPLPNDTGVVDLRVRPKWKEGWEAQPTIQFDADQFTLADVANLLSRAGIQVGIGEGRPDSKRSAGMGWGLFEVCGQDKKESAK